VEHRLQITSGMDKDLLSHGSLDAETLSSMKLESTANPWAWNLFPWTLLRSRMSLTDLLPKMLRDSSGLVALLITKTNLLDGPTPTQEPSDSVTVLTGLTLEVLVCPSQITELLVRILHLRRPAWPFLTTFTLMASSGMMLPAITRSQQFVNKDHKCHDLKIRTLLLFIYLYLSLKTKPKKEKIYC